MNSSTTDTYKNANIPRGPSWTLKKKKKISYFLFNKTKEFSNKNPPLASQSTQYLLSSSCSMRFKSSWRRFCITFSRSTSDLVFREAILPTYRRIPLVYEFPDSLDDENVTCCFRMGTSRSCMLTTSELQGDNVGLAL